MSKYSNILTMFLVVLIVAILGIVGYFAYDTLNAKAVDSNAQSAMEQFEKATKKISKVSSSNTTNTTVDETSTASSSLDELASQLTTNSNGNNNSTEQGNNETGNAGSNEPQEEEEPEKVYYEGYEVKGTIQIPATKVNYPVLESVTKKSLEVAVAIAYGPGLNQVGNTIIYGHNYRNNSFFSNNKKLKNGDQILITDQRGQTIKYIIYKIYETTPNDATYMTRDTEGRREISLQTCTDDSKGRIIIWAAEEGSME